MYIQRRSKVFRVTPQIFRKKIGHHPKNDVTRLHTFLHMTYKYFNIYMSCQFLNLILWLLNLLYLHLVYIIAHHYKELDLDHNYRTSPTLVCTRKRNAIQILISPNILCNLFYLESFLYLHGRAPHHWVGMGGNFF